MRAQGFKMAAAEATGSRLYRPLFLTLLAEALGLAGKIEEALATLDDALAKAAASGREGLGRRNSSLARRAHRSEVTAL